MERSTALLASNHAYILAILLLGNKMAKNVRRRPILVITEDSVTSYSSVDQASAALSVSRQKILRALSSPTGIIYGSDPVICVDDVLEDNGQPG